MGWMWTHRRHNQSLLEFFKREFEGPYHEILDLATVKRNTCYILMKKKERNYFGFRQPEQVFCVVVMLRFSPKSINNFGYKDMDETMGPYAYDCPERILKALEPYPPTNTYAWKWRQKCWENIRRRKAIPKFKVGDVIKFKEPMVFNDGVKRSTFAVSNAKSMRFIDESGKLVKLRRDLFMDSDKYDCIK